VKRQRQQALLELVRDVPLASQREIRRRLAERGYEATQSTISRDLEELGLVRLRDGSGRLRYAAPGEVGPSSNGIRLRAVLSELALSIEPSGNIVVVTTPPGGASVVAEAIDRSGVEGILGTVAGDNTILVVAREGVRGRTVARRLRDLAGAS
jgi:transcriptional regulator of arginine metabolism